MERGRREEAVAAVPLEVGLEDVSQLAAEAVHDEAGGRLDEAAAAADGKGGEEPPHLVALVLVERQQQRVRVGAVGQQDILI